MIGLGNEQVVEIDPELGRIRRVEGVLGIDESGVSTHRLRLCHHLERQCRLARRFGAIDLDDPSAWHPPDSQRVVDADRPGGDARDRCHRAFLAEPHDRALAELLLDLTDGDVDGAGPFLLCTFRGGHSCLRLPWSHRWGDEKMRMISLWQLNSRSAPDGCQAKIDFLQSLSICK